MRISDWSSDVCSSDLQPAANDLRIVMATIKVITDLERIGDEATKIARAAKSITERGVMTINHHETVRVMAASASAMLHDALDAFARLDEKQAVRLIAKDEVVNHELRAVMRKLNPFIIDRKSVV